MIVVCAKRRIIHRPLPISRRILSESEIDLLRCGWIWIGGNWEPRCRLCERIILADVGDRIVEYGRGGSGRLQVREETIISNCFGGWIASK